MIGAREPTGAWWTSLAMGVLLWLGGCGDGAPGSTEPVPVSPPFEGTIFIDPEIITAQDPTTYLGLTYVGQGSRLIFDCRVADWVTLDAYLFEATFDDGLSIEVQVNPELAGIQLRS